MYNTHTHIHIYHRSIHIWICPLNIESDLYLSVDSLEKKQLSLGPSGSFGLPVLVGMGGGRVGNPEGVEDNQSGSESNTEWEGRVRVWDTRELEGKMGTCGVLLAAGKSSSKVTHCWVCFPPGGGGWRRGARAGGMEEGGARGKAGVEECSGAKGSSGVGLRVDGGPNKDMVLWIWEAGAAAAAV